MKKLIFIFYLFFLVQFVFSQTKSDTVYKEYFHGNGQIASKGYLINGKPEGKWKSYHMSGVRLSIGKWEKGKLDSTWIFFNHTGDTSKIINYLQGKKNGYVYSYYPADDGKIQLQSKELYLNDKRNGKAYHYYRNGKLKKIISFVDDVKNGLAFTFDTDSNIISITRYRNNEVILYEEINRYNEKNEKTGVWKSFYTDGIVKEEKEYLNGKLNGIYKIYNKDGFLISALQYENGELIEKKDSFVSDIDVREKFDENENLIFQGSYLNHKPIGIHRYFDKKGNVIQSKLYNAYHQLISEGIIELDGKKQGQWIDYYPEGNIKAEGYYKNDKKTGKWIFYFPNERVKQTGTYSNGKLSGSWKWYFKNGQLRKEEFYIYGLPDGESIEYSDSGTVIAKGNYIQGEKEGVWNYDIGDQTETGKYVMGLKDGKWKRYYKSNGKLAYEGLFLQGSRDGKHVYYFPNGNIKEIQYYETGQKEKSWSKYDDNGELLLVVQYKQDKIHKINGVKIDFTNNNEQ
ncbi:MAG: hypothetical protein SVU94_04255 [Bacteroidota bacterium]|nr:hypothetical protein [Bacteroidota bacterium]